MAKQKKKRTWTKAQKAAASQRAKERHARLKVQTSTEPLKLGGLMRRLALLHSDAQNLAAGIEALMTAVDTL